MKTTLDAAWNNFVLLSEPSMYEPGATKRAAAIAGTFMGLANNGGLNSFLTASYDLDIQEVLEALKCIGARRAAEQVESVVQGLGVRLPPSSQDERWQLLDRHWTDRLDEIDVLSQDADAELMEILTRHVSENLDFYSRLGGGDG